MESGLMRELSELLKTMFSVEDLRRWVTLTFRRDVAADLPGAGVSLAQLSFDVVMVLERHGLIGDRLFEALIAERPGRREEILAIARGTGVGASPGAGTRQATGARAPAAPMEPKGRAGDRGQAETTQAGPVVRVLHLSDFHFRTRTSWDASTVLGRLVEDIAGLVRDGLAPDLVVLTGDIAHGGKAEEYALARSWLEGALLPAARLGVKQLVIAPGNHDVDRNLVSKGAQHIAEGIRGSRDEQHVTEVMEGEDGRLVLRRLDGFVKFMNELGAAGAPLTQPWHRTVHEVRGVRVHCAALVSAWLSADDGDHGKLLLGLWQCNEALREAERADVVIAALHHPWSYMAEWDLAACQAEIERSAGLVLRGHLHEARHDYRQSPRHGGVLELAAGACYENSEHPNGYHLIEIRPDAPAERRARIHPRFWDRTRREWRADLNVFDGPWGELPLRVRGAAGRPAPSASGRDATAGARPDPGHPGGHAVKDEIRSILIEIARERGTIAYSELVQKVRTARLTPGSPELAAILGELSIEEDAAGRGMLSALVVSKSDRRPGGGFFSLARELGRDTSDRQRCWNDELQELYRQWSR